MPLYDTPKRELVERARPIAYPYVPYEQEIERVLAEHAAVHEGLEIMLPDLMGQHAVDWLEKVKRTEGTLKELLDELGKSYNSNCSGCGGGRNCPTHQSIIDNLDSINFSLEGEKQILAFLIQPGEGALVQNGLPAHCGKQIREYERSITGIDLKSADATNKGIIEKVAMPSSAAYICNDVDKYPEHNELSLRQLLGADIELLQNARIRPDEELYPRLDQKLLLTRIDIIRDWAVKIKEISLIAEKFSDMYFINERPMLDIYLGYEGIRAEFIDHIKENSKNLKEKFEENYGQLPKSASRPYKYLIFDPTFSPLKMDMNSLLNLDFSFTEITKKLTELDKSFEDWEKLYNRAVELKNNFLTVEEGLAGKSLTFALSTDEPQYQSFIKHYLSARVHFYRKMESVLSDEIRVCSEKQISKRYNSFSGIYKDLASRLQKKDTPVYKNLMSHAKEHGGSHHLRELKLGSKEDACNIFASKIEEIIEGEDLDGLKSYLDEIQIGLADESDEVLSALKGEYPLHAEACLKRIKEIGNPQGTFSKMAILLYERAGGESLVNVPLTSKLKETPRKTPTKQKATPPAKEKAPESHTAGDKRSFVELARILKSVEPEQIQ